MARDIEVEIRPISSKEHALEIRSIVDGEPNSASWGFSHLTNANLRKIADAIYAHLGIELSDEAQDDAYLRGVEEGRASEYPRFGARDV